MITCELLLKSESILNDDDIEDLRDLMHQRLFSLFYHQHENQETKRRRKSETYVITEEDNVGAMWLFNHSSSKNNENNENNEK